MSGTFYHSKTARLEVSELLRTCRSLTDTAEWHHASSKTRSAAHKTSGPTTGNMAERHAAHEKERVISPTNVSSAIN